MRSAAPDMSLLGDARRPDVRDVPQVIRIYLCDFGEERPQRTLCTDELPLQGDEDEEVGCKQLLERPSTGEPLALAEG